MKIIAISACLLLALTGCNTVNTVERSAPEARPGFVEDKRVETDRSLTRNLVIQSINESTVSGDLLKIQVTLENTSRSVRSFNYKFEWIAEDGMEVRSVISGWRSVELAGREVKSISGVATSPAAVDFRLKLIEPNR